MKNRCSALQVGPDITLYHTGPALDHGPLPSLFYFALSGPDSLTLDPFNQPVQFLNGQMIRIFSMTLPGHENNLPATGAMQIWAEDLNKGYNCVGTFLDKAELAVEFAISQKLVLPNKMAVAGLSRGGFIAAHLAARDERFRSVLGFAPLTCLSKIKEFAPFPESPLAKSLDLTHLAPLISDRHVRLYIGNDDTRVGTRSCFDFAMQLVEHKKGRTSHVELFISPSIGQMGHGTSPEIFQQGAHWVASHLAMGH
ncbi:MAG: alpha/beta hydrolase [Chlamydiae bacterium CG10_big_fil_rev_8_21_14_0_10_42_34]|nr:MAG: alpha/beta hydrolase [Chlamydiae bacterium CG10_big_fil_rev_8_21_14_0_10_42_34]